MGGETEFILKKKTILRLISEKGPVIPAQVYKEIGENVLMASALLSEMASEKSIKISSIKIGGSPLYYFEGQEHLLEKYIEKLHEKEQKSIELLKQKKVLMDRLLDPVVRVSLRQLKDFAKAFEVKIGENKEVFWKWHSFPSNELEPKVKEIWRSTKTPTKTIKNLQPQPSQFNQDKDNNNKLKTPLKQQIKKITKVSEKTKKLTKKEVKKKKDEFLLRVLRNFEQDNLKVLSQENLKTNKESEFVVKIPSAVGNLIYYCKAINKKKCSDKDLSSAFVQGQLKKLPVLFLTTGELTKKAKEMLKKEFKSMVIKRVS